MKKFHLAAAALLIAAPAQAAEIPQINVPYATYRQQLLEYGWKPAPPFGVHTIGCGSPYPEMCNGNRVGSGDWVHPVDGSRLTIQLWPCRHGWCVAPALDDRK
jgi:hypothetical protein